MAQKHTAFAAILALALLTTSASAPIDQLVALSENRPTTDAGAAAVDSASQLMPQRVDTPSMPVTPATQVTAGRYHTCAVTAGGAAKCWGNNSTGQLGDGTTTDRFTPVDVFGLASGMHAVAAGNLHTCALTENGGIKCWGANVRGQLGNGGSTDHWTPVDVVGLGSNMHALAAGYFHTCALTNGGGVKCWGWNYDGALGDGTTITSSTPVNVTGLGSGVRAVATGALHTCAVTGAGGAKCWGNNLFGQLGTGAGTDHTTPVDVVSLTSGVRAIAAGYGHTCALTESGGVKCWGDNEAGQLGDGTTTDRLTPVDVAGLSSGVRAIAVGGGHTCALTDSGAVKCWGDNYYGQLGDGTTTGRLTPVDVPGLNSRVRALAGGGFHTCALLETGGLTCWGDNHTGQMGVGATTQYSMPVGVSGLNTSVPAVAACGYHTCVLTESGEVNCWGDNRAGQLGNGTTDNSWIPVEVSGLTSSVRAIGGGSGHTCAVAAGSEGGRAQCWGSNTFGQLGDGTTTNRTTPADVAGLDSSVRAVAAGDQYTCALMDDGGVKCWGRNHYGQLGDGTTTDRATPVDVSGLSSGVHAIAGGHAHTCALAEGSEGVGVKCWGLNLSGQLGASTPLYYHATPVDVSGLSSGMRAVTTGSAHTCALTETGGVQCWGANAVGQLGNGTTISSDVPVDVAGLGSDVNAVAAACDHTCALVEGGGVKCWGRNYYGQLGDGTTTDRSTPVDVAGLSSGVRAISAGCDHTCALTDGFVGGGVMCWGANKSGQLGVNPGWSPLDLPAFGTTAQRYLPLVLHR